MTTSPAELRAALERRARDAGFARIAIAAAGPLERDGSMLERWLAEGRHASMAYMARHAERRRDPRELLPGCRSVIVVAVDYGPSRDPRPGRSKVARYAQSRDYHRVMGKPLRRLADWLAEASGAPARAFVDTAPVLERGWAERAGLGWIGKNTTLITRDRGSWLLLGEILSAAPLPADEGPHAEFCGTCTACLDACPTDAFVGPGELDARRCISYWTIEHRGPVPEAEREGLGDWLFGCDVCQTVCPWNERFGAEPHPHPLEPRDDLDGLDPVELLGLDEAAFRERYAGTPLMRARWDGMRRNACIVLGNRGDADAVPALAAALDDDSPMIRDHAAWALGRIGGAAARAGIARRRAVEIDPEVAAALDRADATAGGR